MWTKTLQVGCASALIALSSSVIAASKYGVELSGQVNRAVMYADDGVESDTFFVDNDNSSTRFRILSKAKMSDDVTVGANMEVEHESNSSSKVTIGQTGDARSANAFTERKLELYFDSKTLGRLWLGQGDTASNGTSEKDLSGTSLIGYSSITDVGGSLSFRNSLDQSVIGALGDYYTNMDGLSRDDRIRYDTPKLGGFMLSVSASTGEKYDIGLNFDRKFGDVAISAGLGYADGGDVKSWDNQVNGSVSVLFKGFSVTLAGGSQGDLKLSDIEDAVRDEDEDEDEPVFYYAKLGYQFKASALGKTAFSIDYGRTEDLVDNTELSSYGLQFVQKIDKVATELYIGIRNNQLDITGNDDIEDIMTVMGGARVKF